MTRANDIVCIRAALEAAACRFGSMDRERVEVTRRSNGDVTTDMDRAINCILMECLRCYGDGWLSEENEDDPGRLRSSRVWVVDPIDGTREFVEGIPEWCVSVGLVEDHRAVAGGVLNPSTGEMFLGSKETGLNIVNPTERSLTPQEDIPHVLVSRKEHRNGCWRKFENDEFEIRPVGSIAYRLALVAAGRASATCTFDPRSEWDVAAGVALLLAASGEVQTANGDDLLFNQECFVVRGCLAFGKDCPSSIRGWMCSCAKGEQDGAVRLGHENRQSKEELV